MGQNNWWKLQNTSVRGSCHSTHTTETDPEHEIYGQCPQLFVTSQFFISFVCSKVVYSTEVKNLEVMFQKNFETNSFMHKIVTNVS